LKRKASNKSIPTKHWDDPREGPVTECRGIREPQIQEEQLFGGCHVLEGTPSGNCKGLQQLSVAKLAKIQYFRTKAIKKKKNLFGRLLPRVLLQFNYRDVMFNPSKQM
jgi:hypothetical protein